MIDVQGISPRDPLHTRTVQHLTQVLQRLRLGKAPVRVSFVDENGPKGGPDTRCTITVRFPRRAEVVVEAVGDSARAAFDGAFPSLKRQVVRRRDARRELRRRPKKYYVAKRLLAGGTFEAA